MTKKNKVGKNFFNLIATKTFPAPYYLIFGVPVNLQCEPKMMVFVSLRKLEYGSAVHSSRILTIPTTDRHNIKYKFLHSFFLTAMP